MSVRRGDEKRNVHTKAWSKIQDQLRALGQVITDEGFSPAVMRTYQTISEWLNEFVANLKPVDDEKKKLLQKRLAEMAKMMAMGELKYNASRIPAG